jgi:hypothetical protein
MDKKTEISEFSQFILNEVKNLVNEFISEKCFNCGWTWKIEKDDKNPSLCHKCGYDSKEKKFDYKSLEDWKETNKEKSIEEQKAKGLYYYVAKKRKEGRAPAKPGDKDYPKKDAWEKAKSSSKNESYSDDDISEEELKEACDYLEKSKKFNSKDGKFELYEVDESHYSNLNEAEYQGRKVNLGKIMRGDVKKFKVFVKNPKGKTVKVNFGDPNMKIKKHIPARRKSFRARMRCDNPGPKWKARYWACRTW